MLNNKIKPNQNMIQAIKKLLGIGPKIDFGELIRKGATILDVRTAGEYAGGNIRGSINIPLDQLPGQLSRLKGKDRTVITCCASGMRSASAKTFLRSQGYVSVHNGGSWMSLRRYVK